MRTEKKLKRVKEEETAIKIYCVRKKYRFSVKEKNEEEKVSKIFAH